MSKIRQNQDLKNNNKIKSCTKYISFSETGNKCLLLHVILKILNLRSILISLSIEIDNQANKIGIKRDFV